ncbi:MAG TPA: photosystem reaction center subunit H [Syntrophothermus lipocalidus]|uniref:PRC-barrel domain protein n=1 Tax=Syntrophothermus lipocalidus (strain DSM 12680 / TGB-C1) TaxID=643648 RepID=D7CK15_SYNLT|nr:PRC-barrel domain-containing protein [Syntrophothermus lipocalidus]ADI01129.1 PRC-barrel domain protein [Syntrophothermus lipocalidus DSM 12680]HHV77944.1 photosystem reaction center subunit H [Syntrophothermus lipocalidus]
MKKTQEIIGLPVFSIVDGKEVGQVKDLVINPEEGSIEYLLVNGGNWYVGAKVLPYRAVMGIGAHAVTTESENLLTNLNESTNASVLLQRNIKVKGTKVLTKKGNLLGVVSEYEVDENTGKITSLEFKSLDGEGETTVIRANQVLTFGKDVLVVEEKLGEVGPTRRPSTTGEVAASGNEGQSVSGEESGRESAATKLFVERQRQFLMGKRVIQEIRDDAGNVIIPEGALIDEAVLDIAEAHGRLIELSQNIKP